MSLEHALLNRLEARSIQLAQMKQEIRGLRELVEEKVTINEQLAAEVTRERETARANYEHMERQIAGLHGECEQLRREVPLESTREALKNAVEKLQEVNAQLDSAKGEAEEWLKQCHAARRQRDEVKEEARKETQRLSDLCAELQSKYESLLTKITDLGSYAMTLGRNKGEPLGMFMERLALRIAAIESQTRPLHDEIARLNAKLGPLEKLYEVVKKHVDHGAIIDNRADIYDAVAETAKALSQLTA